MEDHVGVARYAGPGPQGGFAGGAGRRSAPLRPAAYWGRQRHVSDLVRLAGGALLVAVTAALANQPLPTALQVNVFRVINELPSFVGPPLLGVMQVGGLAAVPVVALVALVGRRGRQALMIVGSGFGAWGTARLVQHLIDEDPPALRVSQVILHGARAPGFAFPATHVAVAAALATVARGELSRPARRVMWFAVAVVAVARIYVGAHLPADVVGGLGVGWAIGGLANLVGGVRPAVPNIAQLRAALDHAARRARSVVALSVSADSAARFIVETPEGSRVIKAVSRDDPESDWLVRLWRYVAFRQVGDERMPVAPGHRTDHEAYVTLMAEREGVDIAPFVATWAAGGFELLERVWIPGRSISAGDRLNTDLLARTWTQLAILERKGVAHCVLPSSQIVIDEAGKPWITELGRARVGAPRTQVLISRSIALVDLAMTVGAPAAVESLIAAEGANAVRETLPFLQLVDLPSHLRRRIAREPRPFDDLRAEVSRLSGTGTGPSIRPFRVALRNLVPVAVGGVAVLFLLTHIGQTGTAIAALRSANPAWIGAAGLAAALTYLLAGVGVFAASPVRIGFWRTVTAQVAAASANRASPAGLGGMALNVRYLEMNGATRTEAGGVVAVTSITGFVVHTVVTVGLVVVVGRQGPYSFGSDLDASWPLLAAILATSTAAGIAVWYWRLHLRVGRAVRAARSGLASLTRNPLRLALLLGSSIGVSCAYAVALDASVISAGGRLSFGSALVVYFAASAVGAISPTPGGLGTLEAALVAGLSQQGVGAASAVAGVLTYRIITYWLPVLPGLGFLGLLRRHGSL